MYGSKTWNGQRVWKCNNKHAKVTRCKTIALRDKTIEDAFVTAFNKTITQKDLIISICEDTMAKYCDVTKIQAEVDSLESEINRVSELMSDATYSNARVAQDQEEYNRKMNEYEQCINQLQAQTDEKEREIKCANAKLSAIRQYLAVIRDSGIIRKYDEQLWLNTVERVVINPDGIMRFEFIGGMTCEC